MVTVRKPVINPSANPNMIGKGKPGKYPFFLQCKEGYDGACEDADYRHYGWQDALGETEEHDAHEHRVENEVAQPHLDVLKRETQTLQLVKP